LFAPFRFDHLIDRRGTKILARVAVLGYAAVGANVSILDQQVDGLIFFVAGVYDVRVGSLMITIYMSWSPWHYSSQNYGVASMFLRRRGVPVTRLGKRLLHASFQLSWLLVLLAIHAAPRA